MGRILNRVRKNWNLLQHDAERVPISPSYARPPSRTGSGLRIYRDKSIRGSIINRMAVDFAMLEFYQAKLDDSGSPISVVHSSLNDCLTLSPNIDQTAFGLKLDFALTLFEEGEAAIVPIEADDNPYTTSSYEIRDIRVGRVVQYHPRHVTVEVYDDREEDSQGRPVNGGTTQQVVVPKDMVAIVPNPFYSVMNEPNGYLQRLSRKLALLDGLDEAAGSGKLDMLIQLPYTVRGATRRKEAAERRQSLREQLKDDELGIGYIDVSEKVIQLNRPVDNKLLTQIEYLHNTVLTELGLTPEIMNGSASRDTINNYYDRTQEPLATAFREELTRKFLTKTARTQKNSIEFYRDPLKVISISELAEIADKLTRSALITANEFRPKIGLRPSVEPQANMLYNPNMPTDDQPGGGE